MLKIGDRILKVLELGPSRSKEIAIMLEAPLSNVRKSLSAMVQAGKILSNGKAPATYSLRPVIEKPKGEIVRPYPLNQCPEPLKLDLRSHESLCMLTRR